MYIYIYTSISSQFNDSLFCHIFQHGAFLSHGNPVVTMASEVMVRSRIGCPAKSSPWRLDSGWLGEVVY